MGFENSLMNNGLAGMGGYHGVMLMKALDFKYSRSGANAVCGGSRASDSLAPALACPTQ